MPANNALLKLTLFLLLVGLIISGMILGSQLLVPMTWAFLFFFVLLPVCRFLEKRKLSRSLSAVLATLVFCLISGCVLFFLIYEAATILKNEGALYEKIKTGFDSAQHTIKSRYGIQLKPGGQDFDFKSVMNMLAGQISAIGGNIVTLTLIPMYLFFVLNYRHVFRKFIDIKFKGDEQKTANKFFLQSQASIENYLIGTLVLTGLCALMSFIILLIFGVEYAFFFAVFIAVLNLIPYIGNLAAFAVVLFFVWITKESGTTTFFVGLALYAANLVQENFLRPKIVGDKMEMNAMMVFTAVIIGSMIWGFSGMVLFIPLLGILQALLNSTGDWKAYGVLFKD